jgi:hypothetical protein
MHPADAVKLHKAEENDDKQGEQERPDDRLLLPEEHLGRRNGQLPFKSHRGCPDEKRLQVLFVSTRMP